MNTQGNPNPAWKKGGPSPNPGGRPKADHRVVDLAREHTELAIKTLVEIAKNKKASTTSRVAAATALLDRAWGRPRQAVDLSAEGGASIPLSVSVELIDAPGGDD